MPTFKLVDYLYSFSNWITIIRRQPYDFNKSAEFYKRKHTKPTISQPFSNLQLHSNFQTVSYLTFLTVLTHIVDPKKLQPIQCKMSNSCIVSKTSKTQANFNLNKLPITSYSPL